MSVPPTYPDARMAAATSLQPDRLRAVATRLVLLAGSLRWRSPAASRFDARVETTARTLLAAAGRLDEALAELRRAGGGGPGHRR